MRARGGPPGRRGGFLSSVHVSRQLSDLHSLPKARRAADRERERPRVALRLVLRSLDGLLVLWRVHVCVPDGLGGASRNNLFVDLSKLLKSFCMVFVTI